MFQFIRRSYSNLSFCKRIANTWLPSSPLFLPCGWRYVALAYMYLSSWYFCCPCGTYCSSYEECYSGFYFWWLSSITKTYLYNFDPRKHHFYIVKLGFTGVYIIFLIYAQNIDCGYSLEPPHRGGSNEYPQSMFWAEIWKISQFFLKIFSFWRWNVLHIWIGLFLLWGSYLLASIYMAVFIVDSMWIFSSKYYCDDAQNNL